MYTMKEVCEATNLSYETLKYYCNEGLVPNVKRDMHNYRVFDARDIEWIHNLACLKKCGMKISEMRYYVSLCLGGDQTIQERKEILDEKKQELLAQLSQIQGCIQFIDEKQVYYDHILYQNKAR